MDVLASAHHDKCERIAEIDCLENEYERQITARMARRV